MNALNVNKRDQAPRRAPAPGIVLRHKRSIRRKLRDVYDSIRQNCGHMFRTHLRRWVCNSPVVNPIGRANLNAKQNSRAQHRQVAATRRRNSPENVVTAFEKINSNTKLRNSSDRRGRQTVWPPRIRLFVLPLGKKPLTTIRAESLPRPPCEKRRAAIDTFFFQFWLAHNTTIVAHSGGQR